MFPRATAKAQKANPKVAVTDVSLSEVSNKVGGFCLGLWEHLAMLTDQSRWLTSRKVPAIGIRKQRLSKQFNNLQSIAIDPRLLATLRDWMKEAFCLADDAASGKSPQPDIAARITRLSNLVQNAALKFEQLHVQTAKTAKTGDAFEVEIKKGNKVPISKYGGTEIRIDGENYVILREEDILGVIG